MQRLIRINAGRRHTLQPAFVLARANDRRGCSTRRSPKSWLKHPAVMNTKIRQWYDPSEKSPKQPIITGVVSSDLDSVVVDSPTSPESSATPAKTVIFPVMRSWLAETGSQRGLGWADPHAADGRDRARRRARLPRTRDPVDGTAARTAPRHLPAECSVTLGADAKFSLHAPDLEPESWRYGRLVLQARSSDNRRAEDFVSVAAFAEVTRRAGAMAPRLISLLAGTETPADVAAIRQSRGHWKSLRSCSNYCFRPRTCNATGSPRLI
jgi:hypothetical protein